MVGAGFKWQELLEMPQMTRKAILYAVAAQKKYSIDWETGVITEPSA